MVKAIRAIRGILITVTVSLLAALIYGFYAVPDELYTVHEKPANVSYIYKLTYEDGKDGNRAQRSAKEGKYRVNVSLLNIIPVKNSSLTVSSRDYVAVSGELFGLRLFTEGIIIVGVDEVNTADGAICPAENAGLRKGDIINRINGVKVTSCDQVSEIFESSGFSVMQIEFTRNGQHLTTEFTLAYSETEGKYKAGIWIRDSAAGIGTMTFYEPNTGSFAGLGHGVCDIDTGEIIPVCNGDIVNAAVNGCYKGKSGKAGELCGVFSSQSRGVLLSNCSAGVYGRVFESIGNASLYPVATRDEVVKGKAEIIATVDENGPEKYSIEITKISKENRQGKNLVIKVIDEELLNKTGGIVQGMSGSPIIQNGMLVGAVTHVCVNL